MRACDLISETGFELVEETFSLKSPALAWPAEDDLPERPAEQPLTAVLAAAKAEGRELARQFNEVRNRAASQLPDLGTLEEAQEDVEEALTALRALSPLLLLEGAAGSERAAFLRGLLGEVGDGGALAALGEANSSQPVVLRPPWQANSAPRLLRGFPALKATDPAEARLEVLPNEAWLEALSGQACTDYCTSNLNRGPPPLIWEGSEVSAAPLKGLWLAVADSEDDCAGSSLWIARCRDVICLARLNPEAAAQPEILPKDAACARRLLEKGHSVLLLVLPGDSWDVVCGEVLSANFQERLLSGVEIDDAASLQVVMLSGSSGSCSAADRVAEFCAKVVERRREAISEGLQEVHTTLGRWCHKGAKVFQAVGRRFNGDGEDLRLARDILARNLEADYLAHVFSSVLIGKVDRLCAELRKMPEPDLEGAWGRQATQRRYEQELTKILETQLCLAMQASLQEVIDEMAKQESPALETIARVARRGQSPGWDAQIRALELELRPDRLRQFSLHFFGSLSAGVLTGIGVTALEAMVGELALGPVGVMVGVATFVAIGVTSADWSSVRDNHVDQVRARQLDLVARAREQLDFPGLCARRRGRLLEQMDHVLGRLGAEVAVLDGAVDVFAEGARAARARQAAPSARSSPEAVKSPIAG